MTSILPAIRVSAITAVSPAFPAKVFYPAMQVHAGFSSTGTSAYLYFPMPQNFAGKTVVSAIAKVVVEGAPPPGLDLYLQRHNASRPYSQMTYNNRPSQMAGAAVVTGTDLGATYAFDLTAEFQDVANGDPYYGFRLISDDATQRYISVRNRPPTLVLTLSDATPVPDELRPGGVVSAPAPVFVWDAPDDITQVQLQVDDVDGDFVTPTFDTGAVPSILGQVDTDAEGWAGLAGGASADVRVRQYQPDSGWSVWSVPNTITYEALPVITILEPGATSADPTPTYAWSVSAQTSWELNLYNEAGKLIAGTGRRDGADDTFQPDLNGAPEVGDTVTFVIRTWDDNDDRVTAPGAPTYSEATSTWAFEPDDSIDPAEDLTISQVGETPRLLMTWTRPAGIPDRWAIFADGHVIDVFDGAGGYDAGTWTWQGGWTTKPNTTVAYSVAAIIDDFGAGVLTEPVEYATEVTGLWVVDPDTGEYFSLAGEDVGSDLNYLDSSVIYRPPGSPKPIKRTLTIGGISGSARGVIAEYDGRTVAEQEADLMSIKSRPTDQFRVIWGDTNIPALITSLSPTVSSDSLTDRIRKDVTLQVDQVGEFPVVI